MNDVSRRGFLTHSSIGFALASALAVVPGMSAIFKLPIEAPAEAPNGIPEPLVAHVRDLASGEIELLVGTDRTLHRDRDLALRLYAAARPLR